MTLPEIEEWVKTAQFESWEEDSRDESGNRYESKIYHKHGKHYRLEIVNGRPHEQYVAGKGYVHGCYVGPLEVFKKTRVITETYYETEQETQFHDENVQLSEQLWIK